MRVLLTGGHGFIGSRVVRQLCDQGVTVRCLVRERSDTSRLEGLPWEGVQGDVRDAGSLRQAVRDCDAVLHLASPSSWNDIQSPAMHDIVVGGTAKTLEAARGAGVDVVYCSSVIALGGREQPQPMREEDEEPIPEPAMVYAHAKREAEGLCRAAASSQRVVIVNPAEVYGPEDTGMVTAGNLVDFAKSWPVLVVRGGTSVAHVDDIAAGIVAAWRRGRSGDRYLLGGDNLSVKEIAEEVLRAQGRSAPIVTMPTGAMRSLARMGARWKVPLPFNPLVIPYATRYFFVDNRKAREELGVSFRAASTCIAETMDWLVRAGHLQRAG